MLAKRLREFPSLHDYNHAKGLNLGEDELVLSLVEGQSKRVICRIIEYPVLLDSTNMQPKDWVYVVKDIEVRTV